MKLLKILEQSLKSSDDSIDVKELKKYQQKRLDQLKQQTDDHAVWIDSGDDTILVLFGEPHFVDDGEDIRVVPDASELAVIEHGRIKGNKVKFNFDSMPNMSDAQQKDIDKAYVRWAEQTYTGDQLKYLG